MYKTFHANGIRLKKQDFNQPDKLIPDSDYDNRVACQVSSHQEKAWLFLFMDLHVLVYISLLGYFDFDVLCCDAVHMLSIAVRFSITRILDSQTCFGVVCTFDVGPTECS